MPQPQFTIAKLVITIPITIKYMSDVKPRDVQVALIGTDTTGCDRARERLKFEVESPAAGYNCQFLSNSGRQNGSLDPPGESFTEIYLQELQQHLQHLDYVIHVKSNRTVTFLHRS